MTKNTKLLIEQIEQILDNISSYFNSTILSQMCQVEVSEQLVLKLNQLKQTINIKKTISENSQIHFMHQIHSQCINMCVCVCVLFISFYIYKIFFFFFF